MIESALNSTKMVWYCARTKPKQEHIASANLKKNLGLEVFSPRLRFKRATRRGVVSVTEPLFPCYIFIRTASEARLDEIRYTAGINTLVHFGTIIPTVSNSAVADLRKFFETDEPLAVEDQVLPGSEVRVGSGAFAHLSGTVLRSLPAKGRVQLLLEILGRSTVVEVDRNILMRENCSIAALLPSLAAA